jgi:exosome complex RNA-binding protein Csl4
LKATKKEPKDSTNHDDSKAKRKRKKKGNKIGKLEETQPGTGTATEESGIATDTGRASGDDKKSKKKKKSRDPNKKQRKLRLLLWRVCWPLD